MAFLPTNASQVQQFAVALYGIQVGSATMAQVQADITSIGGLGKALNSYYVSSFGSSTTASVAASVAANLGLTGTAATDAAAYITAVLNGTAASARGEAIQGVVSLFSTLTTNATFGAAATAWNTKVAAAVAYTGAADLVTAAGAPIVASGTVFTLSSSADTFQPNSATAANQTTAGDDTFRATTSGDFASADSINGGAGKDTLNAVQTGATAGVTIKPLLTSVETINLTASSGATAANTVTLDFADSTGVESVFLKDAVGTATTGTDFTTTFSNIVAGVNVGISGGSLGSAGGNAPSLTVGVKSASTNTADVLAITLSDALAGAVTASDVETITLTNSNTTATATSTIASLAVDKATSLTIGGSGKLTVTALAQNDVITTLNLSGSVATTITLDANSGTAAAGKTAKLKTVDASSATGGSTVKLTGPLANSTVKLGSGDDKMEFADSAAVTTAKGTEGLIDGGAGKDTLKVTEATLDSTDATAVAKTVNFEVVDTAYAGATNTASVSLTASAFTTINEFVFSGATTGKAGVTAVAATNVTAAFDAVSVTGVENNDTFVFKATQTGSAASAANATDNAPAAQSGAEFASKLDTGNNILNIQLVASATDSTSTVNLVGGAAAAGLGAANGGAGVVATEFEIVNIVSSGKSAATWTGANKLDGGASTTGGANGDAITVGANGKIVITGAKHLDLTEGVGGSNASVDASGFTGMLQVKTLTGNNTLIGGSNTDLLEGGTGVDTYTGGAGADTFKIATAGEAGLTGSESITDFTLGTGGDILDITYTAVLADAATAVDVAAAITSGAVGDTLTATVSKGIITLAGNAVAKIDTAAELKAVFELLDTNSQIDVGAIVMGGNTYVLIDNNANPGIVTDIIQLTGVTTATAVSATAAAGVIVIA